LLYSEGNLLLAEADGDLYLWDGNLAYKIGSHPYEPCTYLMRNDIIFTVIHNAFGVGEIRCLAKNGGTTTSISGNNYDIGRLCRLLAFAAENCPDTDISYVESKMAIEKMKALGAFSPETAVHCSDLGVRMISDRLSRSRKLTERVMYTEDGRVYVRIKK